MNTTSPYDASHGHILYEGSISTDLIGIELQAVLHDSEDTLVASNIFAYATSVVSLLFFSISTEDPCHVPNAYPPHQCCFYLWPSPRPSYRVSSHTTAALPLYPEADPTLHAGAAPASRNPTDRFRLFDWWSHSHPAPGPSCIRVVRSIWICICMIRRGV